MRPLPGAEVDMTDGMVRIRILSGCVIDRENWNPGDELEVPALTAQKLLVWRQAELVGMEPAAIAGPDPEVRRVRRRVRGDAA